MSPPTSVTRQQVRFEEVTPANECVAFFDVAIESLAAHLDFPIYEGYDDQGELRLAFFTLQSGEAVVLTEYLNSAQSGTSLYVDAEMLNIPQVVFASCQQLKVWRDVVWLHPDLLQDVKKIYELHSDIQHNHRYAQQKGQSWPQSRWYEPIDCFHHALRIYTKQKFPEYWAMLQHNLGLTYANRFQGYKVRNLKQSIECFKKSLEVYTQAEFPEKWGLNQRDLQASQRSLDLLEKQSLVQNILEQPLPAQNLKGINLSGADLSSTNLHGSNLSGADLRLTNLRLANLRLADLSGADLTGADLSETDLSGTNLRFADLSGASLSSANVMRAKFGSGSGIPEAMKQDLIDRGAIFDEATGDRSNSKVPVSH
jgi:tetratricopeptide (TPR) repeat protein